jgi:hypothetical protein
MTDGTDLFQGLTMKAALKSMAAAAFLAVVFSPPARALDDLEELLSRDVDSSAQEAVRAQEAIDLRSSTDPSGIVDEVPLNLDFAKPAAGNVAPAGSPHSTTGEISMVPEPSAVALAALALCYFLIFGRRHRWG